MVAVAVRVAVEDVGAVIVLAFSGLSSVPPSFFDRVLVFWRLSQNYLLGMIPLVTMTTMNAAIRVSIAIPTIVILVSFLNKTSLLSVCLFEILFLHSFLVCFHPTHEPIYHDKRIYKLRVILNPLSYDMKFINS